MRTGPNFQITAPTNGQTLSYNGTAWVNGSGGGGPTTKRIASDVEFGDGDTISGFTTALSANKNYYVSGILVFSASGGNRTPNPRINLPASATGAFVAHGTGTNGLSGGYAANGTNFQLPPEIVDGTQRAYLFAGTITVAGTSGNFTMLTGEAGDLFTGLFLKTGSILTFTEIA
jgi:hypothetical protein